MNWIKRALYGGALAALALVVPACMGHTAASQGGLGGSGQQEDCSVFHPDSYSENHPNPGVSTPVQGAENSGSAICR
jgi:hypothetical protein